MKRFLALAVFSLLLFLCEGSFGQLSITNCSSLGLTPTQLIQNWFVGSGVTISNATFNGSSAIISSKQLGSFVASGNALKQMGIDSGMILTSGRADSALGPNNGCGAGMDVSGPGDVDLTVMAGTGTFDKCVIEFDFLPVSDTITFRYVFGSEELFFYCYQYNDAFGFFLSGPGINGTFSNSSIDIALMPGSSNYVTINNCCSDPSSVWCNAPVVCGDSSMCHNSPENSGLYYQYNAMTYVFSAKHVVQPCNLYHIKIAVADALDHILDSGVFLEKGSFNSSSVTGSSQVCVNSSGNVYTTQPGMTNYQWTISPGGTVTSGGTPTSNWVTVTWNTVGHKTVAVNYTSTGGCSSVYPARFDVTVNPLPVPVISGPSVLCADSTGNIYTTQTGMNNYSWTVSPGGTIVGGGTSTSDFINVTWTTAGIQSVSVNYFDSTGCSAANPANYTVNVLPRPVPVITGDSAVCIFSTTYSYTTDPGMNLYSWNISAGGIITSGPGTDSITVIWTVPGPQWVRVTYMSPNGCSAASPALLNVTVTQIPFPAGNIQGPSELCTGSSGIIYSIPVISDASVYVWSLPQGFNVVSGNGTNSIVVDLAADAVTGIITVYGSDLCGNGPVSPPFLAVVNIGVVASAGPDLTTCTGTPVTVTLASASNYSNVHWYTNGTGTLTNSATLFPTYIPGLSELGNVTLFLVASGNAPCENDTSSLTLDILDIVMISAGPDQVSCDRRPLLISGSLAVNYTSLLWTTMGNGTFDDPSIMHPVYYPSAADVSSGHVTLTFLGGSTPPCGPRSDTVILTFIPGPAASPGPDGNICQGMSYKVQGVVLANYSGFKWENSGQGQLIDTGTLNPTYIPAPGELGEVQLTLYAYGTSVCQDSAAQCRKSIFISPDPEVDAEQDQTINYGTSTILTCEPSGGTGSFQFIWNPASLLIDNSLKDPTTVALVKDTVFIITVRDIVTGCEATDSVSVKINIGDGTEDCFVIHNVITPNGDGVNDFLVIDCLGLYPYNHLGIYNRWGDRVNSFVNYNNADKVWRGTNTKGEVLPDGTYYYVMTTKKGFTFNGWILLRSGTK